MGFVNLRLALLLALQGDQRRVNPTFPTGSMLRKSCENHPRLGPGNPTEVILANASYYARGWA